MRVSDILYGLNVQKKAKEERFEDDKCAQKENISENQNTMKKAGHSTNTEQNIIQKDNADYEILGKAPINISFNFVMK